jgi:ATP-binding cassette subfamily B protein
MIGRVPAFARHQAGVWPSVLAAFGLAIGALVLQGIVSPLQVALGELISRRVDGFLARRLMAVSLERAPMAVLEQPEVLDGLNDARTRLVEYFTTPGAAAAGMLALVARYAQLVGSVVVIGLVLGPMPAVVLACTALVARFGQRGSLGRWSATISSLGGVRRRMFYVIDTGSSAALAKEMRVLGIQPWFNARARHEADHYIRPYWKERRKIYFAPFLVFTAVVLVGMVVVLVLLRDEAIQGRLSVLEISLAIQAVSVPLRFGVFFPEADVQTEYGIHAAEGIADLERRFSEGAGSLASGSLLAAGRPRSTIRFDSVRFAYPGSDHLVLDGLDLELEAGRSTAIVGLNGAGKTTLVKLLGRLYEPTGGTILVDGVGLAEFDARSWQRRIAVIFQDFVRYELDARTNVALGAPGHDDDEAAFARAVAWAGADDIIEALPNGPATPLSSRYAGGVDLSGGQWQRIALARALFAVEAGASVLVLDEPTAQLDVRAEVAFFDRFLELTEGLTSIVISHRFSTVRRADRIVVLEHGRVIEDGTHEALLEVGGRYAELFALQARRFAEQEAEDQADTLGSRA